MSSWYKTRCRHCIYLYEGDNGEWICDHNGAECELVPDEDCPAESDWDETDPPIDILEGEEDYE